MTLDFSQFVLFGILCASLHWLIARSEIARPLWSRARGIVAKLLACPACSGFWLGATLSAIDMVEPVHVDVLSIYGAEIVARIVVGALLGVVVTPIVEAVLLWGLDRSAIATSEEVTPVERPQ